MYRPAEVELIEDFPGLENDPTFYQASDETPEYNCIAFALGETSRWYWPSDKPEAYWPDEITREVTLDAFVQLFSLHGYSESEHGQHSPGVEKLAIYEADGLVTHVARQDPFGGHWVSKLGAWFDIVHGSPDSICNRTYGEVVYYMQRTTTTV